MLFVDLRRLKSQLRAGGLPSSDVARYLAGQAALGALLFVPSPAEAPRGWDFVTLPVLAVGGVFYCFRSNGASSGIRFAERYLALSWVVGWRIGLVVAAGVLVGVIASLLTGGLSWLEDGRVPTGLSAATFLLIAFVYWRIGVHLTDVHEGRPPDADADAA